ncbi:MAG TPA: PASTA domain-containing protein [Novosphingobium sp.]|nr:PASTA domain-containing protein [Novosphingobium sp.]
MLHPFAAIGALSAALLLASPAHASCGNAEQGLNAATIIPYFHGLTFDRARAVANEACLRLLANGANTNGETVVAQSLPAGSRVRPRTTISLLFAAAPAPTVPQLIGLSHDAAEQQAQASGFKTLFYGNSGPGQVVVSQSRPAGQVLARGSYLQLQMAAAKKRDGTASPKP